MKALARYDDADEYGAPLAPYSTGSGLQQAFSYDLPGRSVTVSSLLVDLIWLVLRLLLRNWMAVGILAVMYGMHLTARRRRTGQPRDPSAQTQTQTQTMADDGEGHPEAAAQNDDVYNAVPRGRCQPITHNDAVSIASTQMTDSDSNAGDSGAVRVRSPAQGKLLREVVDIVRGALHDIVRSHRSSDETEARLIEFSDHILAMLKAALQNLDPRTSSILRKKPRDRTPREASLLEGSPVSQTRCQNHLDRCLSSEADIYGPPIAPYLRKELDKGKWKNATKMILLNVARMAGMDDVEGRKWHRTVIMPMSKSDSTAALFDLYSGVLRCVDVDIDLPDRPGVKANVFERTLMAMFGACPTFDDVMAACADVRKVESVRVAA